MKKLITGVALMEVGVLLHIAAMLVCGYYVPTMTSWYTDSGKFLTAVSELHMTAYLVVSALIFVAGVVMCVLGIREKEK
ncbi:MAG: hypothetical protein J5626_01175 [Lachnospiraceae bacterium]|nr:hypothetical protein [Lachnospiraceae bacterium]